MKDLQIKKWMDTTRYDVVGGVLLTRDGLKRLEISSTNNLDLYFTLSNCDDSNTFVIGKDFFQVYETFDNLFYELTKREQEEKKNSKSLQRELRK